MLFCALERDRAHQYFKFHQLNKNNVQGLKGVGDGAKNRWTKNKRERYAPRTPHIRFYQPVSEFFGFSQGGRDAAGLSLRGKKAFATPT